MGSERCAGKHFFVLDLSVLADKASRVPMRCERCGCVCDRSISQKEYEMSYFENMCSRWDPEIMHKSQIATFKISYQIWTDRYQVIQYSPGKLICEKNWGGIRPDRTWVEREEDWQKKLEFTLSDEEDQAIHALLEETAFETWEPSIDRLYNVLIGSAGCNDMPGFSCTFRDHSYIYLKHFYHNHRPCSAVGEAPQLGEDYYLESPFIELLRGILKNHGFELPLHDLDLFK